MQVERQPEQSGRRIVVRVKPPCQVQYIELSADETLGATINDIMDMAKRRYAESLKDPVFDADFEFQIIKPRG